MLPMPQRVLRTPPPHKTNDAIFVEGSSCTEQIMGSKAVRWKHSDAHMMAFLGDDVEAYHQGGGSFMPFISATR